ncbi:MAG TPA: UDP-N-acetylmuramate dehydrogenase [Microbacteriaceae bacterium]|nr:UDP-N-acetylmuramate dehydrogenase [Microbacteriaceae bacterium]
MTASRHRRPQPAETGAAEDRGESPVPLSRLTTMGVGGAPRHLIVPSDRQALVRRMRALWERDEPWLLLGGGSNTVAADDGFDGTVVCVATRGIERLPAEGARPGTVRLRVEAGEVWDDLVVRAVSEGWAGIEALSGIPGRVGAAPVQNIGAYGQELAAVLRSIDFLDRETGETRRIEAEELGFGYRTSAIKRGLAGVVVAIELELDATDALSTPVAYEQLAAALAVPLGTRVPLAAFRHAVLGLRAAKGMLLDPSDPDTRSAGSFFTNPIVDENAARRLLPVDAPRWPLSLDSPDVVVPLGAPEAAGPVTQPRPAPAFDGAVAVKLSAAWLIERSGIRRGFRLPGSRAAISGKHTLAITNTGGASATEVMQLAAFVRTRVQAEFGITLHPEPVLVGLAFD